MTWVKICGMTNLEDALVAVEAGADAVGFVFYEKSPRCVTVETVREIVGKLPDRVEKVGVFVSESVCGPAEVLERAGLTTAQVYAKSTREWMQWYRTSDRKLMLAIPGSMLVEEVSFFLGTGTGDKQISAIVVDSGSGERPGGTGELFDWEGAKVGVWALEQEVPVVVAGGLSPHNVDHAIKTFRPWGVDVVSGVEASPGKKDLEKVRAFVRAVREMDRRVG